MFSAKGAVSCQPGSAPQELKLPLLQALKARFTLGCGSKCFREMNRAFSADLWGTLKSGALPQAIRECVAPLALKRGTHLARPAAKRVEWRSSCWLRSIGSTGMMMLLAAAN
jgi:hypothetical protein